MVGVGGGKSFVIPIIMLKEDNGNGPMVCV